VAATASANLVDGGVAAALERLGERFTRETDITVRVAISGTTPMDRDAEVVMLRCAQEGLANVRKHARAAAAFVALDVDATTASLTVTDDGVGFDTSAASSGFGLPGLRERLTLVGGDLAVTSGHTGTRLVATLPLDAHGAPGNTVAAPNAVAESNTVAESGATPPVPNDSKNRSAVPVGIEAPTPSDRLRERRRSGASQ
jgi:signal transduction histidine kinase